MGREKTVALVWIRQAIPGASFAVVLAIVAKLLAEFLGEQMAGTGKTPLSPVLCAVVLGLLWRNCIGVAARLEEGLRWVMHDLLKVGIALVGLRLTLGGVTGIAAIAIPVVLGCITVALIAGALIARRLQISRRLAWLLVTGTAICGCTAVVALSPVIRARHSETAFAVASVILFGCLGMLLYPWIASELFASSAVQAGIFLGSAIHDTSQVIGAALIYSQQHAAPEALAAAGVTKLLRNLSIAVLIPAAAWFTREEGSAPGNPVARVTVLPAFVVFFVLFIVIRTTGDHFFAATPSAGAYWNQLVSVGQAVSELCLICGMAAVGLSVSIADIGRIGWRPLAAGAFIAGCVAVCSVFLTIAVPGILQ